MPLVLAIQPDAVQAGILQTVVASGIDGRLDVVATTDDALGAIDRAVPDLILISALLNPRDEGSLVAHLRMLPEAVRPQMVLMPQLDVGAPPPPPPPASRFALRRRPSELPVQGCEPALFVDQVRAYLDARTRVRTCEAALNEELMLAGGEAAAAAPSPVEPLPLAMSADSGPSESFSVHAAEGPAAPEAAAEVGAAVHLAPATIDARNQEVLTRLQAGVVAPPVVAVEAVPPTFSVDAKLQAVLDSFRLESEAARLAEHSEASVREEQMREAAAQEARVAAEHAASATLTMEIARLRAEWEARLLEELTRIREEAGQKHANEFAALRTQIADLRKAPPSNRAAAASVVVPTISHAIGTQDEPKWSVPAGLAARRRTAQPAIVDSHRILRPPTPTPRYYAPLPAATGAGRSKLLSIAATLVFLTSGGVGINVASMSRPSLIVPERATPASPAGNPRTDIPLASEKARRRTTRQSRPAPARNVATVVKRTTAETIQSEGADTRVSAQSGPEPQPSGRVHESSRREP